jgi:hypothetical protein
MQSPCSREHEILANSNLRLHKIASNKMEAFISQDHTNDLIDPDIGSDTLPMQRSLGLNWDLRTDTFTFKVAEDEKPFTHRGELSTVNSLYDPLGFVAPITIQSKSVVREITMANSELDCPLPREMEEPWVAWREFLKELCNLHIPRAYTKVSGYG